MKIIISLAACFVATTCFAVVFSSPKKALPYSGLCGTLGYAVYLLSLELKFGLAAAVFLAASVIGIAAELLARKLRMPATVFITAGIVPLVPGASAYLAMLHFSQGDYPAALLAASTVAYVACAISAGLAIGTILRRR
ncbi:MAG: threonine/serine exporter family protein [Bacillota bacterium]|nr:threonine/serine exporter family protein [Bacillota bacterium]